MSAVVVEQVKQLIDGLSVTEKVGLVEWLGATVGRELKTKTVIKRKKSGKSTKSTKPAPTTLNGSVPHTPSAEIPWKERAWTQAEIQALMKPEPKTGAEIAAWLRANPDTGGWGEMDMPDAEEWVRDLRHKISQRQEWDQ